MQSNKFKANGSVWRRWHRRLGVASSVFVIILVLTGLALNHNAQLRLDQRHVSVAWLLSWYDIKTPEMVTFSAGGQWINLLANVLYWDGRAVLDHVSGLSGVVGAGPMIVVAMDDEVAMFTRRGRLIERMNPIADARARLLRIGLSRDDRVILQTTTGFYGANETLTRFIPRATPVNVSWSEPATLPEALRQELLEAWRGRGVSLERLLLDIHTGRFLGGWGVWLVDIAALVFLALALSGIWLWWRRLKQRTGSV